MVTKNDTLMVQAEAEARGVEEETRALLVSAEQLEITTQPQYVASAGLLKRIKTKAQELDELRRSMTRPLDEAKSRIMALFRPATDQLAQAEAALKGAMLTFTREEERKRLILEAELREKAAKEAERLMARAQRARDKGQDDKAVALEDMADMVPVPIIASQAPLVSGVAARQTWRAEVTDLQALAKAVGEGQVPMTLLLPNMTVLNSLARSLKKELSIPGVKAVTGEILVARGEKEP